jgi:hypothetical protein
MIRHNEPRARRHLDSTRLCFIPAQFSSVGTRILRIAKQSPINSSVRELGFGAPRASTILTDYKSDPGHAHERSN